MIFSTAKEIVQCGMGAFNENEKLSEQARSATGAALGNLFLLAVSAWLSQPLYQQYAQNQHAAQAGVLGWIFAVIVALLVFAFGADIARNIARTLKGKPTDAGGVIALAVLIWLGLAGFDILVQYYGSEIRAREASGDIIATTLPAERASVESTPAGISPSVAAELVSLAEVNYRKSYCGKHNSMHGNSFREAMEPGPGGEWVFKCSTQNQSYGAKYDKERQVIRDRITDLKELENNQTRADQEALQDKNAGILDIRKATEVSFKFLTFALYVICLFFSVRVSLFLEDLQEVASTVSKSEAESEEETEREPRTGLLTRVSSWWKDNVQAKKPGQAVPDEQEEAATETTPAQQKSNLYGGNEIGFKKEKSDVQKPVENSQGNSGHKNTHKSVHKESIRFVGNQPFDAQDNTGKKYASNATAQRNFQKVKKAFIKYYQKTGDIPQVKTIAQETGIGRNTVAKYMSEITVQITKENDHTIQSPEG